MFFVFLGISLLADSRRFVGGYLAILAAHTKPVDPSMCPALNDYSSIVVPHVVPRWVFSAALCW